jgi:16S rRNA (cytosine967-C5)-methyltransferase
MTALQRTMLAQAGGLVAPGGTLCYVTCAFEPEQNEAVIEAFLASPEGAAFAVEPVAPRLCAALARSGCGTPDTQAVTALTAGPYLRTWPHRHNLDAFFAACLRRAA